MRKKIVLITTLVVVVVGSYVGYGAYMRNHLSKTFAALLMSNGLQQQSRAEYKSDAGKGAYDHLQSVNAFNNVKEIVPLDLKKQYDDIVQFIEQHPRDKVRQDIMKESLVNQTKELCKTFRVPTGQIQEQIARMYTKYGKFESL